MKVLYAKCLLYAYPNLKKIAGQLSDLALKKALASMSDNSPCETLCEKIVLINFQKEFYIELEGLINKALSLFDKKELDCFEYKYFKRQNKEYFERFDCSSRAYFRKQIKLINSFAMALDNVGVTDKFFIGNCLSLDFFKELLKRTVEYEERSNKNKPKKKPLQILPPVISKEKIA